MIGLSGHNLIQPLPAVRDGAVEGFHFIGRGGAGQLGWCSKRSL